MAKTLSEIYLGAARRIASGKNVLSCVAVMEAANDPMGDGMAVYLYNTHMWDERFEVVTSEQFEGACGRRQRTIAQARDLRVLALLFMAAITEED